MAPQHPARLERTLTPRSALGDRRVQRSGNGPPGASENAGVRPMSPRSVVAFRATTPGPPRKWSPESDGSSSFVRPEGMAVIGGAGGASYRGRSSVSRRECAVVFVDSTTRYRAQPRLASVRAGAAGTPARVVWNTSFGLAIATSNRQPTKRRASRRGRCNCPPMLGDRHQSMFRDTILLCGHQRVGSRSSRCSETTRLNS